MNTELTDDEIECIAAKYSLPYSLHSFARELIEHDRAQQDARRAEELAAADLTISNLRAVQGVPDGWVLAPNEATTEMVLALMGTGLRNTEYKSKAASPSIEEMKQGYRAMLAAAPQPEPAITRFNPADKSPETALQMAAVMALRDEGEPQPPAQPERKPIPREHRKALIKSAINARDDDGLITDMEREAWLIDAVERCHGIKDTP